MLEKLKQSADSYLKFLNVSEIDHFNYINIVLATFLPFKKGRNSKNVVVSCILKNKKYI